MMSMFGGLDATGLAALVRDGAASAAEVVDDCLARIAEVDPQLGAFVHVDADAARERAARGLSGPLAGVPFAVKDVVGYPGMRFALGSRLFAANVAGAHVPYTAALDRAGLITVGKTATSELGMLGSTETVLEGVTRNPWRAGLSAAGSSGGAAAAVAAGILPMAHATDGGGSIRVPASACGLFGFKPSNGRMLPSAPPGAGYADLLVDHCVSRTVRDSALLLSCTERHDSAGGPVGHITAPVCRRLRIGWWTPTLRRRQPHPEVAAALDDAARLCADLGHEVEEIAPPPIDGDDLSDAYFTMAGMMLQQVADAMAPLLGRPVGPADLEPFTLELIAWQAGLPAQQRATAQQRMRAAGRCYAQVFERVDAVLTPTLATLPWPLGHLAPDVGRAELIERTGAAVGYTPIHNVAGCPAMSLPLHWTEGGIPVGCHFAARAGDDATLLGLAYQLESARPWHDRRPPLAARSV